MAQVECPHSEDNGVLTVPHLLCTDEQNDVDLVRTLGSAAVALPVFTDCCFSSVEGLLVACERKKVGDLASCLITGRFLNQMATCKEYDADVLVLILEGRYRRNPEDGVLEIPVWKVNPRTSKRAEFWEPVTPLTQFSRFDQYLTELQRDAGIIFKHTENVKGTADVIRTLYDNYQTPLNRHQSLNQFYVSPPARVPLTKPNLLRRVAKELDGVGWTRSDEVAKHFPSVLAMCVADIKEWAAIPGIGKKTAESVVKALQGE